MATFLSSRLKTLRVGIQGYTDNTEVAQFIGNINIDGSVKVNTFDDGLSTGSSNYVITADGTGGWSWKSIIDVGAVTSPGGTDGQVQYNNNGSIGGAAQLYYDDVNSRVGVGTNSPGYLFEVNGDASFLGAFRDKDGDTGAEGQILMSTGSGINWVNAAPASAITGLNIREEGVLQGGANAVATLDFVGSYITATVAGSVATITMTESPDFTGLTVNSNTVWHAGNDGVNSGLDADLLDGQQGSYYLDYTNFTNIPTIGNGLITISTGSGLTGSGNFTVNQSGATTITVSHADTSTQTSVNNANGVVIQDITLDGFGHITAISSVDLDGRYYTETESDARFLRKDTSDTLNGNLTLTGELHGPATFVLDPAVVGDNTGTLVIRGNLQVDGVTTTINSTVVSIDDKNIVLASGAADAAAADGAGITIDGASATLTYAAGGDSWVFNKAPYYNLNRLLTTADEGSGNGLDADTLDGQEGSYYLNASNINAGTIGDAYLPATISSDITGNAATATKLATLQTIALSGDVTGSVEFDGSANVTINAAVANDSHTHDGRYYTEAEADARFLGINAKAADSELLDGINSTSFLRSDADDITTGQIQITKANNTATDGGQIYLNGATGNRIDFNQNGVAAPAFTTRSAGTKIVLYPEVNATRSDYALGIESGTLWYSISQALNTRQHRWYAGTTQLADLKGTGELVIGSTILTGTSNQKLQVIGGAYVSGNVGIGTTAPSSQFVVSNGGAAGLEIQSTGFSSAPVIVSYNRSSSAYTQLTLDGSSNVFAISGIEKARITSDGKLGLGTSAPSSALEVNATAPVITINSAAANASSIEFKQAGTLYGRVRFDGNNFDIGNLYSNGATIINAGNAERARITSDGKLGLGTSSPGSTFDCRGISSFVGSSAGSAVQVLNLQNIGGNSANTAVEIAFNNSASFNTNQFTKIGAVRTDSPVVGDTNLYFSVQSSSSSKEQLRITSTGVGIGTTSPARKLSIADSIAPTLGFYRGSTEDGLISSEAAGFAIQSFNSTPIQFSVATGSSGYSEKARIDASGRLLVGTSTIADSNALLHVSKDNAGGTGGSVVIRNGAANTSGNAAELVFKTSSGFTSGFNSAKIAALQTTSAEAADLAFYTYGSGTGTERLRITADGKLGLGTSAPSQLFTVNGTGGGSFTSGYTNTLARINATTNTAGEGAAIALTALATKETAWIIAAEHTSGSNGDLAFYGYPGGVSYAERLRITAAGNVGIGASNPQYKLEVAGSFAATTKSFVIPHPTKEDMKLRYGSLEGPENGVYVRGKTDGFVIDLPDYWTGLVDEDSITVSLTAIGKVQTLWVKDIKDNKVFVGSKCSTVKYFYTIFAERKDVEKLEVEF